MNIPTLPNLVDEIALMKTLALVLRDEARLAAVPVMPEVKFLMESETALDVLWTLPVSGFINTADGFDVIQGGATGTVGNGILVEMPEMDDNSPGVRNGSPATWKVGIVGFCEPNVAFTPGIGSGFTASQLCQIAQDVTQMLNIYGFGTFKSDASAIKAANDWTSLKPGVTAYRLTIGATVGRVVSQRSANVTASFNAGLCTLTCTDGAAAIYFTTDGTPPVKSNPNATLYSAPFAVDSGSTINFASRKAGTVVSHIWGSTAP